MLKTSSEFLSIEIYECQMKSLLVKLQTACGVLWLAVSVGSMLFGEIRYLAILFERSKEK